MRRLAFILFILIWNNVDGQMPEYYSYLVKGQVQYKRAKAKPLTLAPKTLLFREDVIILPKGKKAELTLVDKNSNYIVLSNPGTYKVAELPQKPHQESESITAKYFHLVWEELFQPKKDFATFKKRNLAVVSGGVSRGDCDVLKTPRNETIVGNTDLVFAWKNFSADPIYTFILSDEKNNEVLHLKVRDTQLILNTASWLISPKNGYYWKVLSTNSSCTAFPTHELRLWSGKEISQRVNEIKSSVKNTGDTSLYHLQVAELLEKENMFDEVNKYYKAVIDQSTDQVLRTSYAAFLLRMDKEKEAEKVYLQ